MQLLSDVRWKSCVISYSSDEGSSQKMRFLVFTFAQLALMASQAARSSSLA